jgi:amino acid permease
MRKLNPEIALGFLVATVFWISVLIWQSYQATVPSEFFSAKLTDWLLAILTFFLVLFTYRLWRSTDKLWAAGEKQIAVARDSADAAKSAADAAKLNAQAVIDAERAFIFIILKSRAGAVTPAIRST